MIDIAKEFGFKIRAFHHAVEAYKIADVLARERHLRRRLGRLVGLQDGGLDGIPENAALLAAGRRLRRSSTPTAEDGIQRLNQEAAKAMAAGSARGHRDHPRSRPSAGSPPTPPALGIDSRPARSSRARRPTWWSGAAIRSPSTARPRQVYIDGGLVFDRSDPTRQRKTDFELGTAAPGVGQ